MLSSLNTKSLIIILFFLSLSLRAWSEEIDIKKKLPQLLESGNAGTEFVFSFHPGAGNISDKNVVRIFVTSAYTTEVRLIIPKLSEEPYSVKQTIKNDIIEFRLPLDIAQPYLRTNSRGDLKPTQVFDGRGIIVQADQPILVFAVSSFDGKGEGFLAIPNHALGTNYTISSYQESASTFNEALTPYVSVVAAYDHTNLMFFVGGNNFTTLKTKDGWDWRPYKVLKVELNRGDVWLLASEPSLSDLAGSMVSATKPVAVLSGNLCAKVSDQAQDCNYLIEEEIPQHSWGTKYFAFPVADRYKSSIVRIFVKNPGTNIWRDDKQIALLDSNYGLYKFGWIDVRVNPDSNSAASFVSNLPINVVQYNTSKSDDNTNSTPFQTALIPEEQFQSEFIYATPGDLQSIYYDKNYLNLIYRSTKTGEIPDDIEYGPLAQDGTIIWKKLKDIGGGLGKFINDPYYKDSLNKTYSKTIKLTSNGVYKFRSQSQRLGATAYGFGANGPAYAFPASMNNFDMEKDDFEPPIVEYKLECRGNTSNKLTTVKDAPINGENCSFLSHLFMDPDKSYNYTFGYDPFIPGSTQTIKWWLKTIDPDKEQKQ